MGGCLDQDAPEHVPSVPESAHQQRGGSLRRAEHSLSLAEGNCVIKRRGRERPETNQSLAARDVNVETKVLSDPPQRNNLFNQVLTNVQE